jgi:hypothetical protein
VPAGDDHLPEDVASDMEAAFEVSGEQIGDCRFARGRYAGDEHHRGVVGQHHGGEATDRREPPATG